VADEVTEANLAVLVVGSGGREHALALALARDPAVTALHVAPGNPGTASCATNHAVEVTVAAALAALATALAVDPVVIGAAAPIGAGVVDAVPEAGIACFGPSAAAARIEGSKAFAKDVMAAAGVPTADSRVCTSAEEVEAALEEFGPPYVIKDDGLASGKGVVVTEDREEALAHAARCATVVVEEFLDGPEVSLFAISDGRTVRPLQPAQDFKRVGDGNTGPNTGGMGAYTPLPWAPADLVEEVQRTVLQPTVDELARRRTPFTGLLYAGLALTRRGVRVVEFNARFGDPETQALLPLLRSPLGTVLHAAATGRLREQPALEWDSGAAVAVVLAAEGYPGSPVTGAVIMGLDLEPPDDALVVQAGTALDEQRRLVSAGGRVLAVVGTGTDLTVARQAAYAALRRIALPGSFYRTDIAQAGARQQADELVGRGSA